MKQRPADEKDREVVRLLEKVGEVTMANELLREKISRIIKSVILGSPFHGEGYRKVWARLRHNGVRTSRIRVLCLMRENNLLAPHRQGKPHDPKVHNGKITTERVDDMWGTDMTSTITTGEGQAAILFAVDHCSMEYVGIHAAKRGTRFEALEPIRQGVRECFGAFGKDVAAELILRHDHLSACNAQADGSQYMSDVFQEEISFLGDHLFPCLCAGTLKGMDVLNDSYVSSLV